MMKTHKNSSKKTIHNRIHLPTQNTGRQNHE